MTSPHMVAVIDLSLESDGWLSGENGEGDMHRAEATCRRYVFHGETHIVSQDECVSGQTVL